MQYRSMNLTNMTVLLILVIVSLSTSYWSAMENPQGFMDPAWRSGWLQNFSTETFGAIATFLLFEIVVGNQQRRREEERYRDEAIRRIIREMRSSNEHEGQRAIEEAREMGILVDGTLMGAILRGAHLNGANLREANLFGADMRQTKLQKADLYDTILTQAQLAEADLHSADLRKADLFAARLYDADLTETLLEMATLTRANLWNATLTRAELGEANLSGATLRNATLADVNSRMANYTDTNLQGATLTGAFLWKSNLSGANLCNASLRNANLLDVIFSKETVLPDAVNTGTDDTPTYSKHWSPGADMARYTDPQHPDFWQPQWAMAGYGSYREWYYAGKPDEPSSPEDTIDD